MLFELALREPRGEIRAIHRNIEFLEDVRQRTEMVFVSMCEDYRSNVVPKFFEEVKIRDANVNSVGGLFGKAHACVENQHLVRVAHRHAIHSKLTYAAERNDL